MMSLEGVLADHCQGTPEQGTPNAQIGLWMSWRLVQGFTPCLPAGWTGSSTLPMVP